MMLPASRISGSLEISPKQSITQRSTGAYQIAEVYAWWGNKDQAVQWLERAYAQYDGGLTLVKFDPLQRSLRPDPRYAVLLREMKFQDGTNLVGAARKLFGP
jgi:hypothetical protein